MQATERFVIAQCLGCGAMREFETCETGCAERRVELIAAADYDELERLELVDRERIRAVLPVLADLARRAPPDGEWREVFVSVSSAARRALRDAGPDAWRDDATADADSRSPAVSVWRCPDCGGVDAPQECIGVCIWRRFEWVESSAFEARRAQASAVHEIAHAAVGLAGRVAFATPREGAWERNWTAFQAQSQEVTGRFADLDDGWRPRQPQRKQRPSPR